MVPARICYRSYGYRYDPGPMIALGLFSAFAGAVTASQEYGYYTYYGDYYNSPAYFYTPGSISVGIRPVGGL